MNSQRLRLLILCEDELHQAFVERLADRWDVGPRQRKIKAAPHARGSAAQFVVDNFVGFVKSWRSQHDANVGGLVVIDGDEHGLACRRQQLIAKLAEAGEPALDRGDPRFAIVIPCWHIETWIAWLCGHRPVDEQACYKPEDPRGSEVGRKIKKGEYSARMAVKSWIPAHGDEAAQVPSLTAARDELRRLGVAV